MSRTARSPKKESRAETLPRCPKCGGRHPIKSGQVQGKQRWKCRGCAYQFTRIIPRGRPLWQKSLVVFLYSNGLSMHAIARIFHVQPSTVLKWVRSYGQNYAAPESGGVSVVEMPDMQRYVKALRQNSPTLCIAIDDATFKKSIGITITQGVSPRF
jgi:transposase